MSQQRIEAWAILASEGAMWWCACDDCIEELRPVRLLGVDAWGAWHKGQAVMLLPQRERKPGRGRRHQPRPLPDPPHGLSQPFFRMACTNHA